MSDKPVMHGRDHRPGGMDPIPGFGGDWIFGYDNNVTVPSQSTPATQYDFTAAVTHTNDLGGGIFTIVSSSGFTISRPGFYIATIECEWAVGGATVSEAAEVVWNLSGVNNQLVDRRAFLPGFVANNAQTFALQGFALGPSDIPTAAPLALKQTGGADATVSLQFAVTRLTPDYGDL